MVQSWGRISAFCYNLPQIETLCLISKSGIGRGFEGMLRRVRGSFEGAGDSSYDSIDTQQTLKTQPQTLFISQALLATRVFISRQPIIIFQTCLVFVVLYKVCIILNGLYLTKLLAVAKLRANTQHNILYLLQTVFLITIYPVIQTFYHICVNSNLM